MSAANYHGDIWGVLPSDYPRDKAQDAYRKLLDAIPTPSFPRELMGYGFKGAAYRYRAAADDQEAFEASISAPGGAAPGDPEHYLQERALVGFFVSGLSCLESLAFGVHAIGAHYAAHRCKHTSPRCERSHPSP